MEDGWVKPVKEPFGPGQRVFIVGGASGLRTFLHLKQSTNAIAMTN